MSDAETITPDSVAAALATLVQNHATKRPTTISPSSLETTSSPWSVVRQLGMSEYVSLALYLSPLFQSLPPERLSGYRDGYPPTWATIDVLSEQRVYPSGVAGLFLAGETAPVPMVVQLATPAEASWSEDSHLVRVSVATEHKDVAKEWLSEVLVTSEREHNILRGRVVEIGRGAGTIFPRIVPVPRGSLSDVVVSETVVTELQKNVMSHIAARETLAKVGIGSNRGVLLWGPPGTGKTSLVRGCIAELAGDVTVLVPDAEVVASSLPEVYREAARLSPCLVVLEDVDVVAADRHGKDAGLAAFLAALDGVVTDPENLIVTIATTNNPAGVDDAAKRPGRIDRMIEVPVPDASMRRAILDSYLEKLNAAGIPVEVQSSTVEGLASGSGGASGALLREVVRRSLLEAGGNLDSVVSDSHLLAAAAEIGYRIPAQHNSGQYL